MSDMKTFQKAQVVDNSPEFERVSGYCPVGNFVVGSAEYNKVIENGGTVLEWWNVWQCQECGFNDSDRLPHSVLAAKFAAGDSHMGKYGHNSVRPAGYKPPAGLITNEVAA